MNRRPCRLLSFALWCALSMGLAGMAVAKTLPWPLPAQGHAAQPQFSTTPDGQLLLSWIERIAPGHHRMRFARFDRSGRWSAPGTVAEGRDWFVNWADVPTMAALADGSLWAQTLEKSAAATYAYDVVLRRSHDGGRSWSAPRRAHDDGTPGEHGFVSMWPAAKDRLALAWLDGRNTAGGHGEPATHGAGRMMLRAATFGPKLEKTAEWPLDLSTCDCCQTDVAIGEAGTVLVYRDRTDGEVRDIYLTRHGTAGWTKPVRVHADNWVMPACPVNGPAVAARGRQVWVAWPTEAGGQPSLRLARSSDAGALFAAPQIVEGADSLGRVDLAADANHVWLLWMNAHEGAQSLWLAKFSHALGAPLSRQRIAGLQGRGRGTGFPRLQVRDGIAHVIWTDVIDGQPRLLGAQVGD